MANGNSVLANVVVNINGLIIKRVSNLTINQCFDNHHSFEVSVSPEMLPDPTMKLKELADQVMGGEIFIELKQGRDGQLNQTQKFKGIAMSVRMMKGQSTANTYLITGASPTLLLNAGRTTRSFDQMTPGDIVRKITSSLGLTVTVAAKSDPTLEYITQYEEDNFHFIQRLAEDHGQWFFYDGEKLYYGKNSSDTGVTLTHGSNFFDMEYSLRVAPMKMTAKYYDFSTDEYLSATVDGNAVNGLQEFASLTRDKSSALFKDSPIELGYQNHQKGSTLNDAVKLKVSEVSNKLAVLQGQTPEMQLKIGGIVKVKDDVYAVVDPKQGATLKETIDYGSFLITRLSHYLDSRGVYQATFEAIPQDTEFPPVDYKIIAPKAESQPALVKQVDDEERMGRVKVQFAWQKDTDQTTPWIRVAQPMTYGDRGVYFIPEKEEVVFVDFELGNPDLPFVRGSMYHGDNGPGPLFDQDNNIKGIITRGGNHIIIDDADGKESIKIYNKDEKNSIELSLQGTHITIKSEGNINIEAQETITMKAKTIEFTADQEWKVKAGKTEISNDQGMKISAGTEVEVVGQAGVKVKGAKIAIEADATATIKANAQLALESSGQASLKGAIVMIN